MKTFMLLVAASVALVVVVTRPVVADEPRPLLELDTGKARTFSIAFSPDGAKFAASHPPTIKIWDTESWKVSDVLEPETTQVYSLTFFPNGKRLVFGGNKFAATVWNLADKRAEHYLHGLGDEVRSVAVSPDGNLVAFTNQKVVRLYDMRPEKPLLRRGSKPLGRTYCVAFSPDGKHLAATAFNESTQFCMWDLTDEGVSFESRRVLYHPKLISGERLNLRSIAFVGKGKSLIGSTGPHVFLMEPQESETRIITLGSHEAIKISTAVVRNIAVSPNGKMAASAAESDGVRLWDLEKGGPIVYLPEFGAWSVAFSPDGKRLVTAGIDLAAESCATKVWELSKIVSK